MERHLAKNCNSTNINENNTAKTQSIPDSSYTDLNSTTNVNIQKKLNDKCIEITNLHSQTAEMCTTYNKRTHSLISSNSSQKETDPDQQGKSIRVQNKWKIIKKDDRHILLTSTQSKTEINPSVHDNNENIDLDVTVEAELDKKPLSIKNYLNLANVLFNYVQFKSLLENTYKVKNPIEIIKQYTNDIEKFTTFITNDVYPNVRNVSIKQRCTRLLNSIKGTNLIRTPLQTSTNSDSD